MKKQKVLACLLAGAMVLAMTACGNDAQETNGEQSTESVQETMPDTDTAAAPEEASIDFEDGKMGFAAVYSQAADAAEVELSIADYNGSKALQVKNLNGKVPYVAFDAASLLGAEIAKVATIEMTVGVVHDNGKFSAVSGNMIAWSGEKLVETMDDWSVYLETKNPNKAVAVLAKGEEFAADCNNIFMFNLKTDNGVAEGNGSATVYLDNIRFLDASGNLLTADSSVEFAAPKGFESNGTDLSNLAVVTNPVIFEGFACTGDGWGQNGFDMTQEILDALVPGAVVQIEFTSETGDMWLVMPDAAAGWMRVGDGGKSCVNDSKTIAQVTYEQMAALLGDDVSAWGARMQCEAGGAWEVYSVKVGQKAPAYGISNAVDFAGFACTGEGWGQNGFDIPQEVLEALVPGSVIEFNFTSESGKLWLVMPDATAGWMRVGDGTNGNAVCYDGKCYITYEQIAELCGEDKSTWGTRMQAEADTAWEVYGARVGTASEMKMVNSIVNFEGFACTGEGWGQNGVDIPKEIADVLVPGSVITLKYTSESGKMWLVVPDATAGWMRVGDGTNKTAACNNGYCQVTYEQIAEFCGKDVSTWGTRLQAESDTAWEVYGVTVGQLAE